MPLPPWTPTSEKTKVHVGRKRSPLSVVVAELIPPLSEAALAPLRHLFLGVGEHALKDGVHAGVKFIRWTVVILLH
jgi:hypothetical protein